jgi:transposase-like protein
MKGRKHSPEQIIRKLREADQLAGRGQDVAAVAKALEINEATLHRWRNQYGRMKAEDAKELKQVRVENQRLKRMVADRELQIEMLREVATGKW